MSERQLHHAAYDVREPSRLAAALQLVRAYATGGQKSVYEIFLTLAEKIGLATPHAITHQTTEKLSIRTYPPKKTQNALKQQNGVNIVSAGRIQH